MPQEWDKEDQVSESRCFTAKKDQTSVVMQRPPGANNSGASAPEADEAFELYISCLFRKDANNPKKHLRSMF
jgi:hypothetical protein